MDGAKGDESVLLKRRKVALTDILGRDGMTMDIVNISAPAVNFADTGTVSELAGAFAAGPYDTLRLRYVVDRWMELSRSNN